jgi:hypothetical protein
MAELHGNGWAKKGHNAMASLGAWGRLDDEENREKRNPIELRGLAYIAFCKQWAPRWVDEEAEAE